MTHYFENSYYTPLLLDHSEYRYGLIEDDGRRGCVKTVLEAAGDQAGRLTIMILCQIRSCFVLLHKSIKSNPRIFICRGARDFNHFPRLL